MKAPKVSTVKRLGTSLLMEGNHFEGRTDYMDNFHKYQATKQRPIRPQTVTLSDASTRMQGVSHYGEEYRQFETNR